MQKELDRPVENGSLEEVDPQDLQHAAPVFSIPRKDGRIRLIHDLRELNTRHRSSDGHFVYTGSSKRYER